MRRRQARLNTMPPHESTGKRAKAKRNMTVAKVACDACKKSNKKWNKDRPSCRTCKERHLECHYSEDPDDSPFKVLKRKYSSLQEAFAEQEREISRLRSRYEPQSQSEESSSSGSPLPCERSVQGSEAVLSSQAVSLRTRPLPYSPPQPQPADLRRSALRLIKALSSKSDFDSTTLLARLRLGEDWRKIADELPAGLVTSETDVQQVAYLMQPKTQVVSKTWLPAIFDRQYFMQICYIPCIPNISSLPTTPRSDFTFGNLSFSSAVTANHQPAHIQQAQVDNLFGPQWSNPILNGSTVNTDPFDVVLTELREDIARGMNFDELCGSHAYIGALDDGATFHRAPKLSQVVARIIGSIKPTDADTTFTQRAMMHCFWALWRWQLRPTIETYREVPEFAKPMPSQFFVAHPSVFDFVVFPKLRERICQADTPNVQWMTEAAITVHCDWDEKISSTLSKDGSTLELDLNPICKAYISAEKNWTLGPSVRKFLSDADSLVSIKEENPA